jgi:hypothetical protein
MSAVGTADADALPASAKVNPAAPNTGTAPLADRLFLFEVCLIARMMDPPNCKKHPNGSNPTPRNY